VSLDTLKPDRFLALTRRDSYAQVLEGIEAVRRMGWPGLKLDTVVMRGVNDDEIVDLLEFARRMGAEIRFIEYMDVGGATRWSMDQVVSRAEILERLGARYGGVEPIAEQSSAPADRFRLPDGQSFGIISSTTAPFCTSCDRSRLTADGQWLLCLYATTGLDLRGLLRGGHSNTDLARLIGSAWQARRDRGAEERLAVKDRRPLVQIGELRAKPHLEMHTRGG
jgi:cyclic pyranopterin phosphate synthase